MLALVLGGRADTIQTGLVALVVAMRKVEPSDGHAGIDELFELGDVPTGRTHGADDFGLATCQIRLGQDVGKGNVGAAKLRTSWSRHGGY